MQFYTDRTRHGALDKSRTARLTDTSAVALLYQTCWCGVLHFSPTPSSSVEFLVQVVCIIVL